MKKFGLKISLLIIFLLGITFNSSAQTLTQDSLALVALYNSTDGTNWTNNKNWLSPDSSLDAWYGINVANGRVSQLDLMSNNLTGTIPPEIGNLTNLVNIYFNNNQLSGSIPPEIGNLGRLKYLFLTNNQLNGSIPSVIGNLDSLIIVNFDNNQLSGSIPVGICNLDRLGSFSLYKNQISGPIPPEIGNLTNLYTLDLSFNQITGFLPAEIGNLTSLSNLFLNANQLSGSIPIEIGNLTSLTYLRLDNNQLSGSIPPEIGNISNLTQLWLGPNQLSGPIPPEIGNLTNLNWLDLSDNQLSGSMPVEIYNLDRLEYFSLYKNQISGPIPPEIGNLTNLYTLDLSFNQLTGFIPAEIGNLTSLSNLFLNANQLSGFIPIEIGNLTSLTYLRLDTNELSGSIPAEIGNLNNLEFFHIFSNQLNGLPDLSLVDSLNYLEAQDNNFTFEDIEPNIGAASNEFIYSPQDSVGIAKDTVLIAGSSYTFSVSVGGTSNRYQWFRNGFSVSSVSTNSSFTINSLNISDAGVYTCKITNTVATELTLDSRLIRIRVYPQSIDLAQIYSFDSHSNISDFTAQDYRLVGLPGDIDFPLEDVLDGEAGKQWQAVYDNGADSDNKSDYLIKFAQGENFHFKPGNGFWLIHNGNWDFGRTGIATYPVNNNGEAVIDLHNGWNIISNPLHTAINWSDVQSVNTGTINSIWSFDGNFHDASSFDPYQGYYYYNSDNRNTLTIPSRQALAKKKVRHNNDYSWRVNIILATGKSYDECNYFGIRENALSGVGPFDSRKPRTINTIPSVNIINFTQEGDEIVLANDVRPPFDDIQEWKIEIFATKDKEAKLTFNGIEDIPDDLDVRLVNMEKLKSIDLRTTKDYKFNAVKRTNNFKILVGKPDLVQQQLESMVPEAYELGSNYPNPFNPATSIPVKLMKDSFISLKIYNILGQQVKTVFEGIKSIGVHNFPWDGTNQAGNRLASGVYIYRLDIKGIGSFTKKMLMIK